MKSTIKHWCLEYKGEFVPPDHAPAFHLNGETYNDFRCAKGDKVTTSPVIFLDFKNKIAETCNTLYKLGDPDPSWLEWIRVRGFSISEYEAVLNGPH